MGKYYKAFHTKKFYLAVNTFPSLAKKVSRVYLSGVRVWDSPEKKTYSLVLYRARIMFGIKHSDVGATNNG